MALSTIMMAQQDQLTAMRERMVQAEECLDAMREMILALEHTQENPIVVDDEEMVVSNGVEGEELEVEENCHRGRPLVGFPWFSLQPN